MTSSSQAVAIRTHRDVATLDQFDDAILNGTRVEELEDPEEISKAILLDLLRATNDAELEPVEAQSWTADYSGVPIEIRGFAWRPSDPKYADDGGSSVFVVVHGRELESGRPVVLTCGARNVLAQLSNLARRDRFPVIRMIEGTETRRGYQTYWLKTPPGYELDATDPANPLLEDEEDEGTES